MFQEKVLKKGPQDNETAAEQAQDEFVTDRKLKSFPYLSSPLKLFPNFERIHSADVFFSLPNRDPRPV